MTSLYVTMSVSAITRVLTMARWESGTQERLRTAALSLFASRGFEETTAAEIAEMAGVTERTFYRYFGDKREVLFTGTEFLTDAFANGIRQAPEGASALEMVTSALEGAAEFFPDERRAYSRKRQRVIEANPALQERELHKGMSLMQTMRDELVARHVPEPAATLAAQSASMVFHLAFTQWIKAGEKRSMAALQTALIEDLRGLIR